MPVLSIEEIEALIAKGKVRAITLDTSIFRQYGHNLQYRILRSLGQFSGTQVKFVLSAIVVDEVARQMSENIKEAVAKLRAAVKSFEKALNLPSSLTLSKDVDLSVDPAERARKLVSEFLSATACHAVPVEGQVSVAQVWQRYISTKPPFASAKEKKSEFPDAFALVALETWAKDNDTLILAVSKDGGWREFAETSEQILYIDDVKRGLALFNKADNLVVTRVLNMMRDKKASELLQELEGAVQSSLDDLDFIIDAGTGYPFDATPESAKVIEFQLAPNAEPLVVDSDEEAVTFTVDLVARVEFTAHFSFKTYDDEGDLFPMGWTQESIEDKVPFSAAITIARELEGEPETLDIDVNRPEIALNFGDVEPRHY